MPGKFHYDKVGDGTGKFHQWGINYEEFETVAGNFSTAIIERDDGTVENVPVEMIQFLKDPVKEQLMETFDKIREGEG